MAQTSTVTTSAPWLSMIAGRCVSSPSDLPTPSEAVSELYESVPTRIEAIQWTGENGHEAAMFGAGKVRIGARENNLTLLTDKEGVLGWVPVPIGHWLVCLAGDKSDMWPVGADYFAAKYNPAATRTSPQPSEQMVDAAARAIFEYFDRVQMLSTDGKLLLWDEASNKWPHAARAALEAALGVAG